MPKSITIQAYEYHELSDSAKGNIRQWLWAGDDTWWEYTYEDFVTVAKCLGFEVHTKARQTRGKAPRTVYDPDIWFDSNYGYTAGYNATWRLLDATHAVKQIKGHCRDKLLIRLATVLEAEIAKFAIVGLEPIMREGNVVVKIVGNEHGIEDGCDSLEWASDYAFTEEQEQAAGSLGITVEATAKDLAKWLAKQLEAEAEYRQSDEACRETCEANEYLFDESGDII